MRFDYSYHSYLAVRQHRLHLVLQQLREPQVMLPAAAFFHYRRQAPLTYAPHGATKDNKTLWIGNLNHWMDEYYLLNCFASTNEINSIKLIRNKHTGLSKGYAFVEFFTHSTAERVLQNYSLMLMPNTDQPFRLNWAVSSIADKRSDLSIFVGDLAANVTDKILLETFSSKYPSVMTAKVVTDAVTGRSKGYGFVRFGDEKEKGQAMTQMQGVYCSTRRMRIAPATSRKCSSSKGGSSFSGASSQSSQPDLPPSHETTLSVAAVPYHPIYGSHVQQVN